MCLKSRDYSRWLGQNSPAETIRTDDSRTGVHTYVANDKYKGAPDAVLRFGNLPAMINADVHSGEDVILTATGSERVRGQIDNTEVFRIMAEALGLGGDAGRMPDRTGLP